MTRAGSVVRPDEAPRAFEVAACLVQVSGSVPVVTVRLRIALSLDAGAETTPDGVHVYLAGPGGREGDLTLDSLAQLRVALCQLQHEILQLFLPQP
jgi:hypothetical protein